MLKHLTIFILLLISTVGIAQEINYKTYSYTQLFELIKNENDSVFTLNNALVKYNLETDFLFGVKQLGGPSNREETLVIDKELLFDNVHFQNHIFKGKDNNLGYFGNIHFKKKVTLRNSVSISIIDCVFDDLLILGGSGEFCETTNFIEKNYRITDRISIENSKFKNGFTLFYNCNFTGNTLKTNVNLTNNEFYPNRDDNISLSAVGHQFGFYGIISNKFPDTSFVKIYNSSEGIFVYDNDFGESFVTLIYENNNNEGNFYIRENKFDRSVVLGLPLLNQNHTLPLSQFKFGFTNDKTYESYRLHLFEKTESDSLFMNYFSNNVRFSDSVQNDFNEKIYKIESIYETESGELGKLQSYYKSKYNNNSANKIYVKLKDLETQRFDFEYHKNPSFKTFFTFKINQFLKVFSAYGTEPARAIIFSMYVIIFFALIYLFFPNSWDSLGKKRLMHRFEFFQKYLRREDGMHTLYLEDKQKEISTYEDFKTNITQAHLELPSFFISWSKPLYNASMFSSRIMARFLKVTDVLQGKWQDLSPKQKRWKNIQIGFLLTVGLFYDLFIKILNALMLSINTFTTLGFGEIPIKGLPRYLAIIQGFIGWFMLTIFSVSLISQLLN